MRPIEQDRYEVRGGWRTPPSGAVPSAPRVADRTIPKLDPNKRLAILSTQFGSDPSNKIVENSRDYLQRQLARQGYDVVDASNMTGGELRDYMQKVAAANPRSFDRPVVVYAGGHGSIVHNQTTGEDRHQLNATDAEGATRRVETVRDVLQPIYSGIQAGTKKDPTMAAFVSSCRAGQAAKDFDRAFRGNANVGVLASSTKDQNSFGPGQKGIEQGMIAYARMLSKSSVARRAADTNGDGAISLREFASYWNKKDGGLVSPEPRDRNGGEDGDPVRIAKMRQTLVVGGNGDISLIQRGSGTDRRTSDEGLRAPGEPTTPEPVTARTADRAAREMARDVRRETGRAPRVDPAISDPHDIPPDESKIEHPDGSVTWTPTGHPEAPVKRETVHPDGSRDVSMKDGTEIRISSRGVERATHPMGPIAERTFDPNTGDSSARYRNGTREVRRGDGSGYFVTPDGRRTNVPLPSTMARGPGPFAPPSPVQPPALDDPPVRSTRSRGRTRDEFADGRILETSRDGFERVTYPSSSPYTESTLNPRTKTTSIGYREGPVLRRTMTEGQGEPLVATDYRSGVREVRRRDGSGWFQVGRTRIAIPIPQFAPPAPSARRGEVVP
jgi:hypothetical protein